jgi:hypothetical protein
MSAGRRWVVALTCLPPVALAVAVYAWGVDLPYWDQWALVPYLDAIAHGHWPLGDLWRQHNEHRLYFPQLLMLALAQLSSWNIRWELAMNVVLATGIFLALVALLRQTADGDGRPWWTWPLLSLMVFSPSQWENWVWGWQLQIFLCVLAVASGLALLARDADRPRRWLPAALCGVVASYSFANGLLFWFLALPLVALPPRRRAWRLLAWSALAAITFGVYFHGFGFLPHDALDWTSPRTWKLFGGYVALYLGAPLYAFRHPLALYGGFVTLVAATCWLAWACRHSWNDATRRSRFLPWLLLASWAATSAVLTATGRLHLGLGQALTSRYVTISGLFWVALLGAWTVARPWFTDTARSRERAVVLALAAALLVNAVHGARFLRAQHGERAPIREALRGGEAKIGLVHLYPDPDVARERLLTLQRLEMSLYRRD